MRKMKYTFVFQYYIFCIFSFYFLIDCKLLDINKRKNEHIFIIIILFILLLISLFTKIVYGADKSGC